MHWTGDLPEETNEKNKGVSVASTLVSGKHTSSPELTLELLVVFYSLTWQIFTEYTCCVPVAI